MTIDVTIALNRFGLGARSDETPPVAGKPWLLDQLTAFEVTPEALRRARASNDIWIEFTTLQRKIRTADETDKKAERQVLRKQLQALYRSEVEMRVAASLASRAHFVERLVHFWSNHFAVSANKPQVTALAGAFEREAIRPHVLGRFEDMLFAVERHPAMLNFLDQTRSLGPTSVAAGRIGQRQAKRKAGINENLAREILELHTLGVRSGYTQKDVTEFGLALTGWTVRPDDSELHDLEAGRFVFRPGFHEPGSRTVMGKTYAQRGEAQAAAILRDLAAAPATALHVATKLARHFLADTPPEAAVARLSAVFAQAHGDLPTLYRALIDTPEAWTPSPTKFKSPWEWAISALRGIGLRDVATNTLPLLNQLGQPIWRPGSPAGYDDRAATWAAPDALVRRVEAAQRWVAGVPADVDARDLASKLFAGSLSERTSTEIARAESPRTALALLLVSPEFLRR